MRNLSSNARTSPRCIFSGSMRTFLLPVVLLGLALLLAGCRLISPTANPDPKAMAPVIQFSIEVGLGTDGDTRLGLTVENTGSRRFPGDEEFNGMMEIREFNLDMVRGGAEFKQLPALEPGEKQTVLEWQGNLDPGTYQVTWGAPGYEGSLVQFQTP